LSCDRAWVVKTPMHRPQAHDFLKQLSPMKRLAEVGEVADVLLYLELAAFLTGEVVHLDGGAHAGKWSNEDILACPQSSECRSLRCRSKQMAIARSREAGRARPPAARPAGALCGVLGAAEHAAGRDHSDTAPTGGGRV